MKTAFLFPGQGSQSIAMLADLAAQYPLVSEVFAEASDSLGMDLWDLAQHGPEEKLNQTEYTQPVLLAADLAVWRLWQSLDGRVPDFMAGHSLGEYSALVAAGSLSLADGIKLVAIRGQLMQAATPPGTGAMAAIIGLDDTAVETACAQAASVGIVSAANYNSPGQVVIAGERAAVEKACEYCSELGARRAIILAVSVPSHCALMQPAAKLLAKSFDELKLQASQIPVLHNTNTSISDNVESIKKHLLEQLYLPVRWHSSISWLLANEVAAFAECGPGKVLSGLNRRIARRIPITALENPAIFEKTLLQWSEF